LLIGAGYTLSSMNEDSELVVIESTGAPPRVVGRPLLLIAAGMSVFTLISNNFIEPPANRQVRDIVSEARGDLLSSAIQTNTFTELDDNVYFNVANVGAGGELHSIFISDARDKNKSVTYYAKTGKLFQNGDTQLLVLSDGQVQSEDESSGKVSIVKFKTYALDLALFPGTIHGTHYYPKERSTAYLFHPDPDDPYYEDRPDLFIGQIHKRFSEWLYPILFGLIAMSFMGKAHSNRSDRMQYDVLAFLVALFYRGVGFYVEPEAGQSTLFAYLCYAVPLFGIASYSALILMERQLALPRAWIDAISGSFRRIGALVMFVPRRIASRRGGSA
ncbi:MAG TPA: LptF/LptG family permease, partial [Pararhizobium sp.]|nr:LptF/LptG family permease [Pararhizobium sp.]